MWVAFNSLLKWYKSFLLTYCSSSLLYGFQNKQINDNDNDNDNNNDDDNNNNNNTYIIIISSNTKIGCTDVGGV